MLAGVRPTIRLASAPTASGRLVLASIATTDGSLMTMPLPRTSTSVFAVPRSMPMSRENRPMTLLKGLPKAMWWSRCARRVVFLGSPAFALPSLEALRAADTNRPGGNTARPSSRARSEAYTTARGCVRPRLACAVADEHVARRRSPRLCCAAPRADVMVLAAFAALVPDERPGDVTRRHSQRASVAAAALARGRADSGSPGRGRCRNGCQHHSPGRGARRRTDSVTGAGADRAQRTTT